MAVERWHFDIDVVGGCNLRCPTCPVGNSDYDSFPKGHMEPELLDKIMTKAAKECGWITVALYNWTEPLLHPKIPELIRVVNSHGVESGISTNLNFLRDADELIAAKPRYIRVSVSGFEQSRYGVTHRRGNIDKVKKNMEALARAKEKAGARTALKIIYHRYLGNHEDEQQMREYARSLGFGFDHVWAYFMPAEKVVEFSNPGTGGVEITKQDREVIAKLAMPLAESMEVAKKYRKNACKLLEERIALTFTGDVMLCCSTYDQSRFMIGNYLDMPLEEIQARRMKHSFCGACTKAGAHVLGTYGAQELDDLAMANVKAHYPDTNIRPMIVTPKKRSGVRLMTDGLRDSLRRTRPVVARVRRQISQIVSGRPY